MAHRLTLLSGFVLASLFAPPAFAASCPNGSAEYGQAAGGFCCFGTTDGSSCKGAVCALDASRTQGNPVCEALCPSDRPFLYGLQVGGFCCSEPTDGNSCSGKVCAVDGKRSQGNTVCKLPCMEPIYAEKFTCGALQCKTATEYCHDAITMEDDVYECWAKLGVGGLCSTDHGCLSNNCLKMGNTGVCGEGKLACNYSPHEINLSKTTTWKGGHSCTEATAGTCASDSCREFTPGNWLCTCDARDEQCVATEYCDGTWCRPDKTRSIACSRDGECASGLTCQFEEVLGVPTGRNVCR